MPRAPNRVQDLSLEVQRRADSAAPVVCCDVRTSLRRYNSGKDFYFRYQQSHRILDIMMLHEQYSMTSGVIVKSCAESTEWSCRLDELDQVPRYMVRAR